jgi:hypothetical protein
LRSALDPASPLLQAAGFPGREIVVNPARLRP